MKLLERVVGRLCEAGIGHALIGAAALAARGVSRSTLDLDLLTLERRTLEASMWGSLESEGATVVIRDGDADDPLEGIVRIESAGERPVDVVVGRGAWQQAILERSRPLRIGDVDVPVARGSDLVLLKLYAGGAQDRWDIQQLLGGPDRDDLVAEVEKSLPALPERCGKLWRELVPGQHG